MEIKEMPLPYVLKLKVANVNLKYQGKVIENNPSTFNLILLHSRLPQNLYRYHGDELRLLNQII